MLLDAQPILRLSVAQIGRFGQPRQGLGLVPRDSRAPFVQARKTDLRQAMIPLGGLGVALSRLDKILGSALSAGKAEPSEEQLICAGWDRRLLSGLRAG